jgi:hypothetical protein
MRNFVKERNKRAAHSCLGICNQGSSILIEEFVFHAAVVLVCFVSTDEALNMYNEHHFP